MFETHETRGRQYSGRRPCLPEVLGVGGLVMAGGTQTQTPAAESRVEALIGLGAEMALAAGMLAAIDALAWRKLSVGGFALLLAGWFLALVLGRLLPARWRTGVELGVPAAWIGIWAATLKQPWTMPQVVYAAGFVAAGWSLWRRLARVDGRASAAEGLRLLLVGGAGVGIVLPYFTDLQLGGRDAGWYSSVFIDFLQQLRSGVFPVFLGQGDLSYNGSANLFRSAPLCLWIGGVWDWLTWQSLSPIAVRNLSLITAAVGAAFGAYCALVRLLRQEVPVSGQWERWGAALGAVLYVLCPACAHALYAFELQMTFTALLALPWIFYGNLRVMQDRSGTGYVALAVGLALAWMAHPPLAIISVCCTLALQFGRFAFEPEAVPALWGAAVRGAVLFVLLSAYYFLSMTELAGVGGAGLPREGAWLLGMIATISSAILAFHGRRWPWLAGWLAGVLVVAWAAPVWLAWIGFWTLLWAAALAGFRAAGHRLGAGRAALLAVFTMLGAAMLAQLMVRSRGFTVDLQLLRELEQVAAVKDGLLRPLDSDVGRYSNSQPGFALLALLLASALLAWWRDNLRVALPVTILGFLLAMILRLPLAADYLVGYAPPNIGAMVNLPMLYRLVPPMAALIALAGLLALSGLGQHRSLRAVMIAGLVVGGVWSAWEVSRIVRRGWDIRFDRAKTTEYFSPDRFALGRYPYNMLYTPLHFMDGKQLPFMDARLLTPHQDLIVGPDYQAKHAEKSGVQVFPLTSRAFERSTEWLHVSPGWTVHPGQTLLLRFEFDPKYDCTGWLTMSSDRVYFEYYLDPAWTGAGFGPGPYGARTLAITNTGQHLENYTMQLKVAGKNSLPRDGGSWGKLHVSRYDPENAPVRVDSLIPLRLRVQMPEDGFLESPRQWIAGYRAQIDGQPVAPLELKSGMLGVPLKAGAHEVEIRYVGSRKVWAGLIVSGLTALGLLISLGRRQPAVVNAYKEGLARWREANRN